MPLHQSLERGASIAQRVWMRLSKLFHRAATGLRLVQAGITRCIRGLPLPAAFRANVYRYLAWRPGVQVVNINDVLLGGQNGLLASDYASASGDLYWTSTCVADGPHVALLRMGADASLTDEQLSTSEYARMARTVMATTGNFFDATDDVSLLAAMRRFATHQESNSAVKGQSAAGSHVRVARIRSSDKYQVIDGHHRIARAVVAGQDTMATRVSWATASTVVQDTVDKMSWLGGSRELYQPVDAPELQRSWSLVRNCSDRLTRMTSFLDSRGIRATKSSYLDVASCYGWFVSQMDKAGFDSYGIERDPLGPKLGAAAYGLPAERIHVGDVESILPRLHRSWDVVSCFSLMHHFALGRSSVSAESLLDMLIHSTGQVLFLDTGQAHEEWFRSTLPAWTTEHIQNLLESTGAFSDVVDLGPDRDNVGAYRHNYGRHLFACVKQTD